MGCLEFQRFPNALFTVDSPLNGIVNVLMIDCDDFKSLPQPATRIVAINQIACYIIK